MKKYNIGIALGGGGTRGFAHLGVLKALNEKKIYPDIISGTSAGAIAGAFIASGKTPEETFEIFKNKRFADYTRLRLPVSGFFGIEKLKKILRENIKFKYLEELKIPLFVTITNITKGEVEYINKGPLNKIIIASSSIPVLFSPVNIKNNLYVDGGLLDNIPVKPLVRRCEKIIAVNIHPVETSGKLDNLIRISARTFQLSLNSNIKYVKSKADLYIEPKGIQKFNILDVKKPKELYELGYNYVKNLKIDL